jgi:hypothetical protein
MNRLGFGIRECEYTGAWQIVDRGMNVDREFDSKEEAEEELRVYYS